jgi:hypothetical protein
MTASSSGVECAAAFHAKQRARRAKGMSCSWCNKTAGCHPYIQREETLYSMCNVPCICCMGRVITLSCCITAAIIITSSALFQPEALHLRMTTQSIMGLYGTSERCQVICLTGSDAGRAPRYMPFAGDTILGLMNVARRAACTSRRRTGDSGDRLAWPHCP